MVMFSGIIISLDLCHEVPSQTRTISYLDASWQPAWEVYDCMVAETISDYWTNFARNSDPNGKGLVEWPAADAENQPYQYIDVVTTTFDELTTFDQMAMEYYAIRYGLAK
jgi:carboxylesterase type B